MNEKRYNIVDSSGIWSRTIKGTQETCELNLREGQTLVKTLKTDNRKIHMYDMTGDKPKRIRKGRFPTPIPNRLTIGEIFEVTDLPLGTRVVIGSEGEHVDEVVDDGMLTISSNCKTFIHVILIHPSFELVNKTVQVYD